MRIRFTIDIQRSRPPKEEDYEPQPQGDVFSQAERAGYTEGPQIGFTREEPEWAEDRRRK